MLGLVLVVILGTAVLTGNVLSRRLHLTPPFLPALLPWESLTGLSARRGGESGTRSATPVISRTRKGRPWQQPSAPRHPLAVADGRAWSGRSAQRCSSGGPLLRVPTFSAASVLSPASTFPDIYPTQVLVENT
ncbi:hypothetical protein GCM10022419_116730 [Nonomuraea rosea]|uniref:Uncharacterized protein n=1 Tax=Nonomuraea rosea TaxID=638574 RepID=A0ABP6ZMP4_9ACTN